MLNAERFKKEILEILDCDYGCEGFGVTKDKEIIACAGGGCCVCSFLKNDFCNPEAKTRWLLSEYKEPVKLSKLEYDILTYILKNTECRYITRNKSRSLCVHSYKPVKDTQYGQWTAVCDKVKSCEVFNNLFPFIKWEDSTPTLIKDVLENCEVVNDAE